MPNEVYEAAVDGLSSLVSPRVARRLVDEALHATSRTPDDVSRSAMRRLLLGRIKQELEGVVPAGAAGPGLKHLAAHFDQPRSQHHDGKPGRVANSPSPAVVEHTRPREERPWWRRAIRARRAEPEDELHVARDDEHHDGRDERQASAAAAATWAAPAAREALPPPESIGVTRSSVYLPDVPLTEDLALGGDLVGAAAASAAAAVAERDPGAVANAAAETVAAAVATTPAASRSALPEVTERLVERAVRVFAELETVRQIVAVRRGIVLRSSGTGIDSERLQGLSVATTALLSKAGTLRVFSLEHDAGVLFLFPMKDGAIVVLTQPKVNIGAVLSARAALEEAA